MDTNTNISLENTIALEEPKDGNIASASSNDQKLDQQEKTAAEVIIPGSTAIEVGNDENPSIEKADSAERLEQDCPPYENSNVDSEQTKTVDENTAEKEVVTETGIHDIKEPETQQTNNNDDQMTGKSVAPVSEITEPKEEEVKQTTLNSESVEVSDTAESAPNVEPMDSIDRALNNEAISYSSDEEEADSDIKANETSSERIVTQTSQDASVDSKGVDQSDDSSSSSDSSSESDESSDSEDEDSNTTSKSQNKSKRRNDDIDLSDDEDEANGPVRSKNEVEDDPAPELSNDYTIPEKTQIEFAGYIHNVSEKTVLIRAGTSGEYRILKENSIFCFEDKTPVGYLYETFGRIQSPIYVVKFNSVEKAKELKGRIGEKVFYVVPSSSFILTAEIKKLKGCDASNIHDEELPLEEQEFSDDEIEQDLKRKKKNKKSKNKRKQRDNEAEGSVNTSNNQPSGNENKRKVRKVQNIHNNDGGHQGYSQYPPQYNSFGYQQSHQPMMGYNQMPQQGYQNNQQMYMNQNQNQNLLSQLQSLTPEQVAYLQQAMSMQQQQSQVPMLQPQMNQYQNVGTGYNPNSAMNSVPNVANILLQSLQQNQQQQMQPDYGNNNQQQPNYDNQQ